MLLVGAFAVANPLFMGLAILVFLLAAAGC
jgi:hypothetical protein